MIPRISISNYDDATEIYEALAQAHRDIVIQSSTALSQKDVDSYNNRNDHLQGLMALVADEVLRIGNLPAETIAEYVDRASAEDMNAAIESAQGRGPVLQADISDDPNAVFLFNIPAGH